MADFTDSLVFNYAQQSPMEPCSEPTEGDFAEDEDTLIWANINGQMRIYSYNGSKVQYQIVQLGLKIDIL